MRCARRSRQLFDFTVALGHLWKAGGASIHQAVLERLGQVLGGESRSLGEVGDRPRHFEHAMEPSCGQVQSLGRSLEQPSPASSMAADAIERTTVQRGVEPCGASRAGELTIARGEHARPDRLRTLRRRASPVRSAIATGCTSTMRSMRSSSGPDRRPRYLATCCGVQRHARLRIAAVAARARIHRRHENEPRRKAHRSRGASDGDAAFFEGLAQAHRARDG